MTDINNELFEQVGKFLVEQLEIMTIQPQNIVVLDGDNSLFEDRLQKRYSDAVVNVCELDDVTRLPYDNQSVDMIFSNLSLLNNSDLADALLEIKRIVKADGLFIFSLLGVDTLKELSQAWKKIDDYSHVNTFPDMHDVGDLLLKAHFSDPVMQRQQHIITYEHVADLFVDLKALNVKNLYHNKSKGLTGKDSMRGLLSEYDKHKTKDNKIPVSLEIIYGHCWGSSVAAGNQVNIFT